MSLVGFFTAQMRFQWVQFLSPKHGLGAPMLCLTSSTQLGAMMCHDFRVFPMFFWEAALSRGFCHDGLPPSQEGVFGIEVGTFCRDDHGNSDKAAFSVDQVQRKEEYESQSVVSSDSPRRLDHLTLQWSMAGILGLMPRPKSGIHLTYAGNGAFQGSCIFVDHLQIIVLHIVSWTKPTYGRNELGRSGSRADVDYKLLHHGERLSTCGLCTRCSV